MQVQVQLNSLPHCLALRICQTQDSWITGIKDGQFIQGVVFKDKNPNPTKQCNRPFFGVLFNLCGRGWFDTWWIRTSQQVVGLFVFEDYRVNGNVVVEWLGCPMGYRCLLALMRLILEEAGACTKRETQGYTMHSARHTLPLIARIRGESAADRQEIGRWSMSAAQDPTMHPLQSVMKKHNVTTDVLPDRYAQSVPAQAVFNVMERQVATKSAARKVYLGTRRGRVFKARVSRQGRYIDTE